MNIAHTKQLIQAIGVVLQVMLYDELRGIYTGVVPTGMCTRVHKYSMSLGSGIEKKGVRGNVNVNAQSCTGHK